MVTYMKNKTMLQDQNMSNNTSKYKWVNLTIRKV